MKTRKEAAELVNQQLKGPDTSDGIRNGKTLVTGRVKAEQFHYGKQELRELLDFIFGPPESDDEHVV